MSDQVLTSRENGVLVITLNRPAQRNALNRAVAEAVRDAADELDTDDTLRAGVLTGAGGVFSSGMDLKAFLAGETPLITGRGLCGITQTPPRKPLIAAVEGWALAGGFELVLACDMVVSGRSAQFGLPEVKRSLVAGGGGALLLPQRVPTAIAMHMLLTGEAIGAVRAAAIGLVNLVVDDGAALENARELARVVAANGPLAIVATKQIARSGPDWSWAEGWRAQERIYEPVGASEDAREGAEAFAEKRAPVWSGR